MCVVRLVVFQPCLWVVVFFDKMKYSAGGGLSKNAALYVAFAQMESCGLLNFKCKE